MLGGKIDRTHRYFRFQLRSIQTSTVDTIMTCTLQHFRCMYTHFPHRRSRPMGLCHQVLNQPPARAMLRGKYRSVSACSVSCRGTLIRRAIIETDGIQKDGPTQLPNRIHTDQYLNSAAMSGHYWAVQVVTCNLKY